MSITVSGGSGFRDAHASTLWKFFIFALAFDVQHSGNCSEKLPPVAQCFDAQKIFGIRGVRLQFLVQMGLGEMWIHRSTDKGTAIAPLGAQGGGRSDAVREVVCVGVVLRNKCNGNVELRFFRVTSVSMHRFKCTIIASSHFEFMLAPAGGGATA